MKRLHQRQRSVRTLYTLPPPLLGTAWWCYVQRANAGHGTAVRQSVSRVGRGGVRVFVCVCLCVCAYVRAYVCVCVCVCVCVIYVTLVRT